MFSIRFAKGAVGDLERIVPHMRGRIIDVIEESLRTHPLIPSRNRKELIGLVSPWEQVRPVWELRVGEYRVFYDVNTPDRTVIVRAIRHKGRKTTQEIL
jgi:mRNA-degrading endonuclease RelE of RelBE toxin-antitoxin system